jgi:hypothetical protein
VSDTPTLFEAIVSAIERRLLRLMGPMPGRVLSYDETKQKVSVQPLIYRGYIDEEGTRKAEKLPVITDVPVQFPGAGSYRMTWPITVGDTVLLVFTDSSMDRWLVRGGEVDPEDDRHHSISDAVAFPGLHDYAHVPTTAPTDAMVLHAELLRLGGPSATDPVVRKSDLDLVVAKLNAHIGVYNAHIHAAGTPNTSTPVATDTTMSAPAGSAVTKTL